MKVTRPLVFQNYEEEQRNVITSDLNRVARIASMLLAKTNNQT